MAERKSHTRELKSSLTQSTLENGKNIYSASRKFNVDRKRNREWLKQEESLVNQKCGSRSNGRGCTLWFQVMEQALYGDYKKARDEGKQSKGGLIVEQSSSSTMTRTLSPVSIIEFLCIHVESLTLY